MGATTVQKTNVVFGIPDEIKPLEGFPVGRVRLRLRPKEFAKAFVKTPTGIRQFLVEEKDGKWIPAYEQGCNETASNASETASETVSVEVGRLIHAFPDEERRNAVRQLRARVQGLELQIAELTEALRMSPHDSECHPSEGVHSDRCLRVKALLKRCRDAEAEAKGRIAVNSAIERFHNETNQR